MTAAQEPTGSVFLSHAGGRDDRWTRWLEATLRGLGLNVEVDYSDFKIGHQLARSIDDALTRNRVFICLFSPRYFEEARWTLDELAAAWSATKRGSTQLIPFEIERVNRDGLYGSLITKSLYELTENAAINAVAQELGKLGAVPKHGACPLSVIADLPPYPGPQYRSVNAHTFRMAVQVDNLIAESAELAHKVAIAPDLTEMHMAELMTATQLLARSYNYDSPARILELALPQYHDTSGARDATLAPQQLAELHYVLGRLHAILSYATLDLGRADIAANHARAVIRCAEHAAHDELRAWGCGTVAMILRFQGRSETSLDWALRGLTIPVSGSPIARLHAQAALSYVELGDTRKSTEHLQMSDALVDAPPASPEMRDGIFLFSRAKHHYYAGSAFADFGSSFAERAVTESEHAIDGLRGGDLDSKSYSDELLAYVHLARGLYMSQRLEEIPAALRPLFETDPQYRTSWHVQWLDRLVVALNHGRSRGSTVTAETERAVTEFKSQLDDEGRQE